jgi:dihydroflavonol-4-reductase
MIALVTGANGLIGANLCRSLLKAGYEVRALVRKSSDLSEIGNLKLEIMYGDVLRPETLHAPTAGCDIVFHAASVFSYWGVTDADLEKTAVEGVSNVLVASRAAGVKRVVLTSSSVVFGSSTHTVVRSETSSPDTVSSSSYCLSKLRQQRRALELAGDLDLDLVIVNPCMTVGPHDAKLSPSNAVIIAYLADPFHTTFPGGCNIVAVQDVADGHLLAAEKGRRGECYLLGSENMEWSLIHRIVGELCGVPGPQLYANHTVSFLAAAAQEMWAQFTGTRPATTREQAKMVGQFYWYSHAKAQTELGYAPGPARAAIAKAVAGRLFRLVAKSTMPMRRCRRRLHEALHVCSNRKGSRRSGMACCSRPPRRTRTLP